jgi:hypothetical protein
VPVHSLIPVGAVLRDRYYEVENFYTFPVDTEGWEDACRLVNEKYAAYPGHPACVVDLVWDLRFEVVHGMAGQTGMIDRERVQHLDDEHWQRVQGWRPALPEGVGEAYVRNLSKQCSWAPVGRTVVAASDTCRQHATSAVETPEGNRLYRCEQHKGRVTGDTRGRIRMRVQVRQEDVHPSLWSFGTPRLVPA